MLCRRLAPTLTALLLATASPGVAADLVVPSRIEKVTVYPGVASVSRVVAVKVPAGQHQLVVDGLPANVDPASLRIEGQAVGDLQIGSVELRTAPVAQPTAPVGAVAARLQQLRLDKEQKASEIQVLTTRRAMAETLGQQTPTLLAGKEKPVDPELWVKALDALGQSLGRLAEEQRMAQLALRRIDEEIAALSRQGVPQQQAAVQRAAYVNVDAGTAGADARLTLTYQVAGATWRPAYDAALILGGKGEPPRLTLVRRAIVTQRTGEDWADVALSVSTAQARGSTAAPELPPLRAAFNEPSVVLQAPASVARPMPMARGRSEAAPEAPLADTAARPAPAPIVEEQATLAATAFSAQFEIGGKVTIGKDGSPRTFRLSTSQIAPAIQVRSVPALDPRAFLEASFTHDDNAPLLPGDVALTRDGLFIGQGRLSQTAPGDSVTLGFGLDERVVVTRVPLRRRETESSWLQGQRGDTREFKTVVKNLHELPMRITVLDQTPFSENSAITVEMLNSSTPPTERNVKDRRGVMAWSYDYKPREEREIRVSFRMRWPNDRELVLEPQPLPR